MSQDPAQSESTPGQLCGLRSKSDGRAGTIWSIAAPRNCSSCSPMARPLRKPPRHTFPAMPQHDRNREPVRRLQLRRAGKRASKGVHHVHYTPPRARACGRGSCCSVPPAREKRRSRRNTYEGRQSDRGWVRSTGRQAQRPPCRVSEPGSWFHRCLADQQRRPQFQELHPVFQVERRSSLRPDPNAGKHHGWEISKRCVSDSAAGWLGAHPL